MISGRVSSHVGDFSIYPKVSEKDINSEYKFNKCLVVSVFVSVLKKSCRFQNVGLFYQHDFSSTDTETDTKVQRAAVVREAPGERVSGSFFFDLAQLTESARYTLGLNESDKGLLS